MMETLLDRLLDNIAMAFHVGGKENIDIKSKIGEGFSGAEVYLVIHILRFVSAISTSWIPMQR